MNFKVITLFPETIEAYVGASILGRAKGEGIITVSYLNPRDFTTDKHRTVDLRPFGGGPGMVMTAEPLLKAWTKAMGKKKRPARTRPNGSAGRTAKAGRVKTILFAADGKPFTNEYAKKLAKNYKDVILICGRYEGVDERVAKVTKAEKISIGDYIL